MDAAAARPNRNCQPNPQQIESALKRNREVLAGLLRLGYHSDPSMLPFCTVGSSEVWRTENCVLFYVTNLESTVIKVIRNAIEDRTDFGSARLLCVDFLFWVNYDTLSQLVAGPANGQRFYYKIACLLKVMAFEEIVDKHTSVAEIITQRSACSPFLPVFFLVE